MIVHEIFDAAYGRSFEITPEQHANEDTELLEVVRRSLRRRFSQAARINRFFFAARSEPIEPEDGSWPRPADAEMIFGVELDSGVEVAIVSPDDREAEPEDPAVYEFGGRFHSADTGYGPEAGEGGDRLVFLYSRRPALPTLPDDEIDPAFPVEFADLLILDVAIYILTKIGNQNEIAALAEERTGYDELYRQFLEHATVGVKRRKGHAATIIPPHVRVAGGA